MKNSINILISLLLASTSLFAQGKYTVPQSLSAQGYPAHVELNFENAHGFTYAVFASTDNGKTFTPKGETRDDYFLDFWKSAAAKQPIVYRILPKGMAVTDKAASRFEVKTALKDRTDAELIDMVQRYTTRYFYDYAHPDCGMARERSNNPNGDIVTVGGTGFGIMALVAGAERNYFPREKSYGKINQIVTFLEKAERFHGAWAHWYNGNTGKPFSFSKYDDGGDIVETAFMVEGLLTARQYFKNGNDAEQNLSERINQLWRGVEWTWYTNGTDSLYWHWSKNWGWRMKHRIKGFDETLITYILAASSPTFAIRPEVYHACYPLSTYFANGKSYYGIKLSLGMEYGGPLFFTHYSFLGLNPKGLNDRYADYWERNQAHVLIHRAYAIDNPQKHTGLGTDLWGFTSSDDALLGYTSHHPGTNDENGTVSPTAPIASIAYTPEYSLQVIRHLYYDLGNITFGKYGFYDAYNPGMEAGQQVVRSYLAIDQGPIAVMLENYRSGLIWKLFAQNEDIQKGLTALGFYYK